MQNLFIHTSMEKTYRRRLGDRSCLADADPFSERLSCSHLSVLFDDLRHVSCKETPRSQITTQEKADGYRFLRIDIFSSKKYRSTENETGNIVLSNENVDDTEELQAKHGLAAVTETPDALSESGNNADCSSGSFEFDTSSDEDNGSILSRSFDEDWKPISEIPFRDKACDRSYNRSARSKNVECTEGLGSESSDFQEDQNIPQYSPLYEALSTSDEESVVSGGGLAQCAASLPENSQRVHVSPAADEDHRCEYEIWQTSCYRGSFPPPLSYTGPEGAPSNSFSLFLRPYRKDGRFVLKEVRVPRREYLQASRRDGRLRLELVRQNDDENFARPRA